MILIVKVNDDGDWNAIEGESAAERGSTVYVVHKGREIGSGEVLGFKRDNRTNQRVLRFARNVEPSR